MTTEWETMKAEWETMKAEWETMKAGYVDLLTPVNVTRYEELSMPYAFRLWMGETTKEKVHAQAMAKLAQETATQ